MSLSSTRRGVESGPSWSSVTEAPWPRVERTENRTEQRNKTRRDGRRTNQEQEEKGMLALRSIHFSRKREGKGKRRESVESNRSDAPEKEGPKRRKRVRRDIHSILSSPDLLFSLPPLSLFRTSEKRDVSLTQPSLVSLCYYNIPALESSGRRNAHKRIFKEYQTTNFV